MLPIGELSYNGFTFPPALRLSAESRPVFTENEYEVKWIEIFLTADFVLTGQMPAQGIVTDLNAHFDTIRKTLSKPGARFVYKDKGFGDIDTNSMPDLTNGPHPEILAFNPVGENGGAVISWQIRLAVAPCDLTPGSLASRLTDLSYMIDWSINSDGSTVRTISGQLSTPGVRTGWTIPQTADAFRTRIAALVPLGFTREQQSFTLSPNRRELSFTLIDVEVPGDNAFFPGSIRPEVDYSLSSAEGFAVWSANLSGSLQTAKGTPRSTAWLAFLIILKTKTDASVHAIRDTAKGQRTGGIAIFTDISISESIFTRNMRFNVSWLLGARLDTVLKAAGLWVPLPNTWSAYRTHMVNTGVWGVRGVAGLSHLSDAIISTCSPNQTLSIIDENTPVAAQQTYNPWAHNCPSPENSWISFRNIIELVREPQTVIHQPLKVPEPYTPNTLSPGQTTHTPTGPPTSDAPLIQRRTNSRYFIRMRGWAVRAGHEVPPVELVSLGGFQATPLDPQSQTSQLIPKRNCDIHMAKWDRYYVLDGLPAGDLSAAAGAPNPRDYQ